jgi:hypothetical protein
MKVITLAFSAGAAAALIAMAPATLVSAQPDEAPAAAPAHGNWTLKEREKWLEERINRSRDDGSLAHSEFDHVRRELGDIRHDEDRMRDRHDGQLTDNETTRLEARLDNVAATIHWLRSENLDRPW